MVHKPKHNVHSFRGLLGDGGQDEINLERSNVNLAYRIVKLAIIGYKPGRSNPVEHIVSIWREEQTSIPDPMLVDFSDPDLLGVALWAMGEDTTAGTGQVFSKDTIIFDNTLFSRNIYVTSVDNASSESCSYYLELEEVPVTASTLMQLKLGVARKLNLQQD
jgi:hypothetical protein